MMPLSLRMAGRNKTALESLDGLVRGFKSCFRMFFHRQVCIP